MSPRKPLPFSPSVIPFLLLLAFAGTVDLSAQELPGKIRGYKVHRTEVQVAEDNVTDDAGKRSVSLEVGSPRFSEADLFGATLTVDAALTVFEQSGSVDFLSFNDFRVNGIKVEIDEYRESFKFRKGAEVQLPEPLSMRIGYPEALRAAAKEIRSSKEEWQVTGTVFVFGRFRKGIFKFKRVVPIDVSFNIPNPLR